MADAAGNSKQPGDSSDKDPMRHLRDLIVGPTTDRLDAVEAKFERQHEITGETVGQVLPDAVRERCQQDDQLARAMGPMLGEAFRDSVRRNPQELADAISPIMGPAIRLSIRQQLQAMVQSLNQTLEHSFSPRSLAWRWEAWRTGKSFAEVVLIKTLVYRIDQLLLIDRESGLLMQTVSALPNEDADLVSSLLSAIQDFARESFPHQSEQDASLLTMRTGEFTIWIQHGPQAYLAAAIRGEPPISLRQDLEAALEQLHVNYGRQLQAFAGDTDSLTMLRPDMQELLRAEFVDQPQDANGKPAPRRNGLAWAMLALIFVGMVAGGVQVWREYQRRVLSQILDVPPTARLSLSADGVTITGAARTEWIKQARNRAERLPNVQHVHMADLVVTDHDWIRFIQLVRAEPGLVLLSWERIGSRYVMDGLRDPDAVDPAYLMGQTGIDSRLVEQHWEPYRCEESLIVLKRELRTDLEARDLGIPDEVTVTIEDGKLVLVGSAKREWAAQFHLHIRTLQQKYSIDTSRLRLE